MTLEYLPNNSMQLLEDPNSLELNGIRLTQLDLVCLINDYHFDGLGWLHDENLDKSVESSQLLSEVCESSVYIL
jgi:hypothetical protein